MHQCLLCRPVFAFMMGETAAQKGISADRKKKVCTIAVWVFNFQQSLICQPTLPTDDLFIFISVALHLRFWRPVPEVQMKSWRIYFQSLIYSFCSHSPLLRWVWGWADLPTSIIIFKALYITYSACVRPCACVHACVFGKRVKEHWSGMESEQMSARIVVQLKLHTSQAER